MTMHTPTISDQARALATSSAASLPADVIGAFAAAQAALETRGVPQNVVAPGSVMPDGDLLDVDGAPASLTRLRAGRPAVVVFYRGAWCPYCNLALSTYQAQLLAALAARNVALIAVSPQVPDESLNMQQKNDLAFPVLSDPTNTLASHLGVLSAPSPEARAAQLQLGLDLTVVNADGTTAVPMPTTVIVDANHVIRWIDVHPDYSTRSEPAEILAALDVAGI